MNTRLINQYLAAKEAVKASTELLKNIEDKIFKAVDNTDPEGPKAVEAGRYKVTVSNKLIRSLDLDAYNLIRNEIPLGHDFISYSPKIDLKKLRGLEEIKPELVTACITTKPAKPVITIKE